MAKNIDFYTLLRLTQEYISQHYAAALTDKVKLPQLKAYIDKYLRDNDYRVDGMEIKPLIDLLYREMAEYSILTPYVMMVVFTAQFCVLMEASTHQTHRRLIKDSGN